MKKIFTTLFMLLSVFTLVQAQNKSKGSEFSVVVGYNSAYVSNGSNQNTAAISGFNFGVSLDNYFSDRWSLKVKAVYDHKGWANGFLTVGSTTYNNVDYRASYITVPVMANWHFGKTRNWYLNFGPYVGFLTYAHVKIPGATFPGGYVNVKSLFSSTDVGLDAGIGIKFPVSNKSKLYIEYDGQSGFGNIFQSSTGGTVRSARASFNVGLTF
jgi:hypothetical protein